MRILLIANFLPDKQESMQRFGDLLDAGLRAMGHEVEALRPEPFMARLLRKRTWRQKWLGYVDKFLIFPWVLMRRVKSCDVVHICDHSNSMYTRFLRGRPNVVTCHDLIAVRSALGEVPESPTGWTGRVLQRSILSGLRRAQFVACVSEHTMRDVLRIVGRERASTCRIHNGFNYAYGPMDQLDAGRRVRLLTGDEVPPFFLHVGGNQPYKNRPGVLEIFASLISLEQFSRHRLIMVGKPFTDQMRSLIEKRNLGEHIVELTSVTNEDLHALYSLAEGLIFPSLDEGFGWPVVEAQVCGCPVFTSNRSPMTEIGGSAAVYFDPLDPSSAAEKIAQGLSRRRQMVEQGLENAKRFAASTMLESYASLYRIVSAPQDR